MRKLTSKGNRKIAENAPGSPVISSNHPGTLDVINVKQGTCVKKVYINSIKVLDGDFLDAEAIKDSGRSLKS